MIRGFEMARKIRGLLNTLCIRGWIKAAHTLERHAEVVLLVVGIVLLYGGTTELAHAGSGSMTTACNKVLMLIEGAFGALVCAVAGVAAIIAASMGGFKMAWTLVVVSVGSFILRSYVSLFNGECLG
jgi:hypothetical protein